MTALALAFLLAGRAGAEAAAPRISDSLVQIGIVPKAASLTLRPQGAFSAVDQSTGERRQLASAQAYPIDARPGVVHIGPFAFQGPVRLLPGGTADYVELGTRRYQGSLLVKPNGDSTVTVVQETGIEEYLYGVVPHEMSPDWPEEALKAQAVVARTFTLANLGKYKRSGYDLSDDQKSQVYSGVDTRDARATAAVKATEGEVLYHHGKVLKAFFHSCCGGHTANVDAIWGGDPNPDRTVRGVRDRYCSASPHFAWKTYLADDDILEALQTHGFDVGKLRSAAIGEIDRSGFVKTFKFYTDQGRFAVKANDFRNWVGNNDMKSTKVYRLVRRRHGYDFMGRGYGHGVGLCQWGAREMAEAGKSYRQILQYFYPGAELRRGED